MLIIILSKTTYMCMLWHFTSTCPGILFAFGLLDETLHLGVLVGQSIKLVCIRHDAHVHKQGTFQDCKECSERQLCKTESLDEGAGTFLFCKECSTSLSHVSRILQSQEGMFRGLGVTFLQAGICNAAYVLETGGTFFPSLELSSQVVVQEFVCYLLGCCACNGWVFLCLIKRPIKGPLVMPLWYAFALNTTHIHTLFLSSKENHFLLLYCSRAFVISQRCICCNP